MDGTSDSVRAPRWRIVVEATLISAASFGVFLAADQWMRDWSLPPRWRDPIFRAPAILFLLAVLTAARWWKSSGALTISTARQIFHIRRWWPLWIYFAWTISLVDWRAEHDVWSILGTAAAVAVFEEFTFRGIVLNRLQSLGRARAVGISAVLFSAAHSWNFVHASGWESGWQYYWPLVAGIMLGQLWWETKCLWLCVALHLVNNGLNDMTFGPHRWSRWALGEVPVELLLFSILFAAIAIRHRAAAFVRAGIAFALVWSVVIGFAEGGPHADWKGPAASIKITIKSNSVTGMSGARKWARYTYSVRLTPSPSDTKLSRIVVRGPFAGATSYVAEHKRTKWSGTKKSDHEISWRAGEPGTTYKIETTKKLTRLTTEVYYVNRLGYERVDRHTHYFSAK